MLFLLSYNMSYPLFNTKRLHTRVLTHCSLDHHEQTTSCHLLLRRHHLEYPCLILLTSEKAMNGTQAYLTIHMTKKEDCLLLPFN